MGRHGGQREKIGAEEDDPRRLARSHGTTTSKARVWRAVRLEGIDCIDYEIDGQVVRIAFA